MNTVEQLGKASRRSAIVSLLSFFIIVFSLAYSSYHLYNLQKESTSLEIEIRDMGSKREILKTELDEKQKKIDEVNKKLEAINKTLFEIGISSASNTGVVTKAIDNVIQQDPKIANIIARVYLHIRSEGQREGAKQIGKALQSAGYIVPGIEILVDKGPNITQLRYFRKEEETEAKKIFSILTAQNMGDAEMIYIKGYENSPKIRPRHFEVWFAPNI